MIPVFDGHNDAFTRDDAADFAPGRDGGHLDLPRAREGGLAGGIFAMFTPTPGAEHIDFDGEGRMEIELAAPIGREMAAAATTQAAGRLLGLERDGHVRLVGEIADLDAARADGVLAAVLHHEGAEAIDSDLEALELWYAAGLRSIGPVWSRPNAFAHGVPFAFPASPDTGPGLTAAGRPPRPRGPGRPPRRAAASCAAARSSASRSTSATSTRPASGTSRASTRR